VGGKKRGKRASCSAVGSGDRKKATYSPCGGWGGKKGLPFHWGARGEGPTISAEKRRGGLLRPTFQKKKRKIIKYFNVSSLVGGGGKKKGGKSISYAEKGKKENDRR